MVLASLGRRTEGSRIDTGRRGPALQNDGLRPVLGHDRVADDAETIVSADLFENPHGEISGAWRSEQRSSLIAAASDEVKIAASGDALEMFGHRREERPTLCLPTAGRQKAQRAGHPGGCFLFPSGTIS